MTSPKLVLALACLLLTEAAQPTDLTPSPPPPREGIFISANVGDEVTLRCDYESKATRYYWYKQNQGQRPRLISSFYKFEKNGTLQDEFKRELRFTLETGSQRNNLKIANAQLHDSGIYHCVRNYASFFEFAESTTVHVKDSGLNIQALVYQSGSGTVRQQDSVTLNCTVHSSGCYGEHAVYWLKRSRASHPGLIYSGGGRTKHCERSENAQTRTCVYSLPMEDLTESHRGTYYCAVVSCGHIVFGNGTRLDLEGESVSDRVSQEEKPKQLCVIS
ncbi:unnamed protein product [Ophioblennius macclurei]